MTQAASVRAMTEDEYARWREAELASYAQEMVDSGLLAPDEARARSAEQHAEYLPQEQATPRMHVLRVLDDDLRPVGVLWVGPHPRKAGAGFVYDVVIDEEHRGAGHGRAAMLAAERICREEGWAEVGLNVFGPNVRARGLYDSLGYRVVTTTMTKPLD